MPETPRRKYICAGNYRQFVTWCQDRDISRSDPMYRYVLDEQGLRGLGPGIDIHIIGTFNERRDAYNIRGMIEWIQNAYEDVQVYWE